MPCYNYVPIYLTLIIQIEKLEAFLYNKNKVDKHTRGGWNELPDFEAVSGSSIRIITPSP
jgi:hypothetical protein